MITWTVTIDGRWINKVEQNETGLHNLSQSKMPRRISIQWNVVMWKTVIDNHQIRIRNGIHYLTRWVYVYHTTTDHLQCICVSTESISICWLVFIISCVTCPMCDFPFSADNTVNRIISNIPSISLLLIVDSNPTCTLHWACLHPFIEYGRLLLIKLCFHWFQHTCLYSQ